MDRTSTLIEGIFPFNPLWLAGLGGEEKIIYSFLVLGVSFLVLGVSFLVFVLFVFGYRQNGGLQKCK